MSEEDKSVDTENLDDMNSGLDEKTGIDHDKVKNIIDKIRKTYAKKKVYVTINPPTFHGDDLFLEYREKSIRDALDILVDACSDVKGRSFTAIIFGYPQRKVNYKTSNDFCEKFQFRYESSGEVLITHRAGNTFGDGLNVMIRNAVRKRYDELMEEEELMLTPEQKIEIAAIEEAEKPKEESSKNEGICLFLQESISDAQKRVGDDSSNKFHKNLLDNLSSDYGFYAHKRLAKFPDWQEIEAGLDTKSFPHFAEFIEWLRQQYELSQKIPGEDKGIIRLEPILLVGEPGIGKTEILMRLSELLSTDILVFDASSAQTGSRLTGSESHWSNSKPGLLFDKLIYGNTANPFVFVDELDKAGASANNGNDTISGLHHLLEKRTAAKFEDLSVPGLVLDASHVNWFASANELNLVPGPIRSRFRVMEIPSPTPEQVEGIVQSIYRSVLNNAPWGAYFSNELESNVVEKFRDDFSIRELKRAIESACSYAASEKRNYLMEEDVRKDLSRKSFGFLSN